MITQNEVSGGSNLKRAATKVQWVLELHARAADWSSTQQRNRGMERMLELFPESRYAQRNRWHTLGLCGSSF